MINKRYIIFINSNIYIAIGSNLPEPYGSPLQNCQKSIDLLNQYQIDVIQKSPWYTTIAEPDPSFPAYINGVVKVKTNFQPQQLLNQLLKIEKLFGRIRKKRNEPRSLDLDLLAYDQVVIKETHLELSHLRIPFRNFVLKFWNDIDPLWKHPLLDKTIQQMLNELSKQPLDYK